MRRRFLQFSLRGLLGAATFACLFFGGWHLLETYGSYVELSAPAVDGPMGFKGTGKFVKIYVRGRVIRLFGPSELEYSGSIAFPGPWKGPMDFGSRLANRSWLCLYEIKAETPVIGPITEPSEYEIGVALGPRPNTPSIREKVIVEPW